MLVLVFVVIFEEDTRPYEIERMCKRAAHDVGHEATHGRDDGQILVPSARVLYFASSSIVVKGS